MKHVLRCIWCLLQPPSGRGARRVVAGIMIIMALGRLGLYASNPLTMMLSNRVYGLLLLALGCALYIDGNFRLMVAGRVIAALGAILMAGMALDIGTLGVTALLEGWMALILLKETFNSHDY
jgi:hypothetical protein